MNDWILHHIGALWIGCILFGILAGLWTMSDAWGPVAAAIGGAMGGAGTAFILSVSRYIRADDRED